MIIFLEKSTRKESNGYYCQISESEIQSFNQQWTTYEGKQGGSNIKLLLQKVIVNCNTNAQEETRLVDLAITRPNLEGKNVILPITVENAAKTAQENIIKIRNEIEPEHTYYVYTEISTKTRLLSRIIIKYEESDEFSIPLPDLEKE
jgi:hypothetical protein